MDYIVRRSTIEGSLELKSHPLNESAQRQAVSLGDLTGLSQVGLHYTVVKPGITSTEPHRHRLADEFMFILSGEGTLHLDKERVAVGAGDFIGLPARGPNHAITNTGKSDLVYLVGGTRPEFDVCEYPDLDKRVYLYFEGGKRIRDFVANTDVDTK